MKDSSPTTKVTLSVGGAPNLITKLSARPPSQCRETAKLVPRKVSRRAARESVRAVASAANILTSKRKQGYHAVVG